MTEFKGRRFENIVRDLKVDEQKFQHAMGVTTPPVRSYVIVFTARSGSSWLTSVISATNRLGHPEEYINPDFVFDVAKFLNCQKPASFLRMLMRQRKTDNGIFGIETREADISLFGQECFFNVFDEKTVFFNLWRENIVAQAISLYRAVATKRYHSNEGDKNNAPPPYDADAIQKWLAHLAQAENDNIAMLHENKRAFINICYENIVQDRKGTLNLFAQALDVEIDTDDYVQPVAGELRKIGDSWNEEAEQRYREERGEFVGQIEAAREIKKVVP